MYKLKKYPFIIGLLLMAALLSCGKSTETVIVQNDPTFFSGIVHEADSDEVTEGNDFIHLTIGESDAINTQDPLFAENNSELRLIHLLYDGLTRLDEKGSVLPALTSHWEISPDSLQYTFYLRTDIHYHNSVRFSSGLGRTIAAGDVKFDFERMADPALPQNAARLFNNITGFEKYAAELQTVKLPSNRVVTEIDGIKAPNDSTVVFILHHKNSSFLRNLAHPYASVYPKESLPQVGPAVMQGIGTGPFYFAKKEADRLILATNRDYFRKAETPDRLDIIAKSNENDLFQSFARGNITAVIEIGPETLANLADSAGSLKTIYKSEYNLVRTPVFGNYRLYFNPESGKQTAAQFAAETASDILKLNDRFGTLTSQKPEFAANATDSKNVTVAYTTNPFQTYLIHSLGTRFAANGYTFSLSPSFAIGNDITFSPQPGAGLIPVLNWKVPVYILEHGDTGISLNAEPWNITFSSVTLSSEQPDL